MQFKKYLKQTDQTANSFADKHGFPNVTIWRAARGMALRPDNARKISAATQGAVSWEALLFPEKNKGRG